MAGCDCERGGKGPPAGGNTLVRAIRDLTLGHALPNHFRAMTDPTTLHALRAVTAAYVAAVCDTAHSLMLRLALFETYSAVAAQVLSRPEMDPHHLHALEQAGDPSEVLAAMFVQKKLAATPEFKQAIDASSKQFLQALAAFDPMLVVWIAGALAQVRPAEPIPALRAAA